jgi:hypothetical protein
VSRSAARLLWLLWLAAPGVFAAAGEPQRASAAMRVATLTERVAKLQAQLGQGILADRSRRALPEALRDLESTIRTLGAHAPSAEIHDNYVLLGILAQEYRPWALKAPTRDGARKLAERTEEIVWVASKNARLAEERLRTPAGTLAFHAAQAATLSQRVARLRLLQRWGIRDEAIARELPAASEELRHKLELLATASQATPEILAEVQVAQTQFQFLLQAAKELDEGATGARQIEFIAKTADHILESMERVATLYDALAP